MCSALGTGKRFTKSVVKMVINDLDSTLNLKVLVGNTILIQIAVAAWVDDRIKRQLGLLNKRPGIECRSETVMAVVVDGKIGKTAAYC